MVVDGETGLLVPLEQYRESPYEPKHPEQFALDLAASINKLMADESLRQSMGEAGRKRAVESFSWSSIAAEVRKLYASIIDTP